MYAYKQNRGITLQPTNSEQCNEPCDEDIEKRKPCDEDIEKRI